MENARMNTRARTSAKAQPKAVEAGRAVMAVDVGNSTINLGLLISGELVATWTMTTPKNMTPDEARMGIAAFLEDLVRKGHCITSNHGRGTTGGIVASVVPDLTDVWVDALYGMTGRRPLVVGPGLKTGIRMSYNDPGELGADRMADLVASKALFEPPFIIVDLGTTTNFEIIDADGAFIGGIIAPGLKLSAKAVSEAAARLTRIELKAPNSIVGKNTREAMQVGIVMGEIARIDGLIAMVWDELGYTTDVIATGSDATAMTALSQRIERVDEHLTLRGLGLLYDMNRHN